MVSIENPLSSHFFKWPEVVQRMLIEGVYFTSTCYCRWHKKYKKPTGLVTSYDASRLHRKCLHSEPHAERLQGKVRLPGKKGKFVNKMSLAAKYPRSLAKAWAKVLKSSALKAKQTDSRRPVFPNSGNSVQKQIQKRRGLVD